MNLENAQKTMCMKRKRCRILGGSKSLQKSKILQIRVKKKKIGKINSEIIIKKKRFSGEQNDTKMVFLVLLAIKEDS